MNIVLILRGSCGSGKSFWVKENGLEPYTLSPDAIRLQIQSPILTLDGGFSICQKNEKMVWNIFFEMLENRMSRGELTVLDATHSKETDFAKYKRLIDKYRYRAFCVDFSNVPLEVCKAQNRSRASYRFVPEDVIDNIYSRFRNQRVPNFITLLKPEEALQHIKIKPLNYEKYEKIVVFGDIHSCWEPLKKYFDKNPYNDNTYYLFVGDTFDRGLQTKEVAQFLIENHNKPNFCVLHSNHGEHFLRWAYDCEDQIKSRAFLLGTKPALEEMGLDKGVFRNIARRFAQMSYFEFHGEVFLVTHGGIPYIPSIGLEYVASKEFTFGTGKYEETDKIIDTWNRLMPENCFSIHGHRNLKDHDIINGRVINLEEKVEFGGYLRIVEITKDSITPIKIKNNHFYQEISNDIVAAENIQPVQSVKDFVDKLKLNRYVFNQVQTGGRISSLNFRKSAFHKDGYKTAKDLPRGFFYDNSSYEIIARGYPKCYNYGEKRETELGYLIEKMAFPIFGFKKENGFIGFLGYNSIEDKLEFCSKSMSDGTYSDRFNDIFINNHWDALSGRELKDYLKQNNCCLVFECIDPINDPHIIKYDKPEVILLDVIKRDIKTEYLRYDELKIVAQKFGFKCKELLLTLADKYDLTSFIEEWDVKNHSKGVGLEGFMFRDGNGEQFKKKTPYYQFWKHMRSLKETVRARHQVNLAWLNSPLSNDFYGFLRKLPVESLEKSIIDLREKFLEERV